MSGLCESWMNSRTFSPHLIFRVVSIPRGFYQLLRQQATFLKVAVDVGGRIHQDRFFIERAAPVVHACEQKNKRTDDRVNDLIAARAVGAFDGRGIAHKTSRACSGSICLHASSDCAYLLPVSLSKRS